MIFKSPQIDRYLKKPDNAVKFWLVYGSNEGLMSEYVRNLTKAISPDIYDPFQVVYLNGEDVNADAGLLIGEFNAQSLMGGRRVVVIKNADNNLTKVLKSLFDDAKVGCSFVNDLPAGKTYLPLLLILQISGR